jgi:hypothetical protein
MARVLVIDVGLKTLTIAIASKSKPETRDDEGVEGVCVHSLQLFSILPDPVMCSKDDCKFKATKKIDGAMLCGRHSRGVTSGIKVSQRKTTTFSFTEIVAFVKQTVESLDTTGVTSVVIELQPRVNNKMKFTSHVLFAFLATKCSTARVKFVNARRKLQNFSGPVNALSKSKSKYIQRKQEGIHQIDWYLASNRFCNPEFVSGIVNKCTKKDDLCDTLLMVLDELKAK